MHKGIVMDITEKSLVVLTPDGAFREISRKNRNCRVGEEIVFSTARSKWNQPKFFLGTASAAAIIVCLMLFSGATGAFANKEIVAYVSVDINPSVEMGIDSQRKVRGMQPLNDDGTVFLRNFVYKGKPVEQVTEELLAKAETDYLSKGEAEIVITSTLVNEKTKMDETALTRQLKQVVDRHVAKEHPQQVQKYDVEAFTAPAELRQEAQQKGVSAGKYIVYLSAKNNGIDVPLESLKKESVREIAKESGGIDKLLGSSGKMTKDEVRKLWKEEKEGSLDKKMKEQEDKKGDKKIGQEKTATPRPVIHPSVPSLKTPSPTPRATQGRNDDSERGNGNRGGSDRNNNDNRNGDNGSRNGNDYNNRGDQKNDNGNNGAGNNGKGDDGKKNTPTPAKDSKKDNNKKDETDKSQSLLKPTDPKKPEEPKRTSAPQRDDRSGNSDNGNRSGDESRD